MEKLHITRVIILEGRYDKIKVSSVTDAMIIVTDGYGIFKDKEKRELIKRLAKARGLIVISDSDSAGNIIRNHLRSFIPADQMVHIYVPCIKGKERRKDAPSREGLLGVEGMDVKVLYELLLPYADTSAPPVEQERLTKARLFQDKMVGSDNSSQRRKMLLKELGLPEGLSTSALIEAVNLLGGLELYLKALKSIEE